MAFQLGGFLFLVGLAALLISLVYDAEVFSGARPRLVAVCVSLVGAAIILLDSRKSRR